MLVNPRDLLFTLLLVIPSSSTEQVPDSGYKSEGDLQALKAEMQQMKLSLSNELDLAKKSREESENIKFLLSEKIEQAQKATEESEQMKLTLSEEAKKIREESEQLKLSLSQEIATSKSTRGRLEQLVNVLTEDVMMIKEEVEALKSRPNEEPSDETDTQNTNMFNRTVPIVKRADDDLANKVEEIGATVNVLTMYHGSYQASIGNLKRRLTQIDRNVGFANGEVRKMKALGNELRESMNTIKDNVPTKKELIDTKYDLQLVRSFGYGLKRRLDQMPSGSEILILNGEEKGKNNPKCARVCAGTTGRSTTKWGNFGGGHAITTYVDMEECGFTKIPTITTSLEGYYKLYALTGSSSVYEATKDHFTVIIYHKIWDPQNGNALKAKWNVEWTAVGYSC